MTVAPAKRLKITALSVKSRAVISFYDRIGEEEALCFSCAT